MFNIHEQTESYRIDDNDDDDDHETEKNLHALEKLFRAFRRREVYSEH